MTANERLLKGEMTVAELQAWLASLPPGSLLKINRNMLFARVPVEDGNATHFAVVNLPNEAS